LFRSSRALSAPTQQAAYAPFTPSKSGQRLPPPYYRGCWHGVSRGLFRAARLSLPPEKEFTTRRPSSSTRRCSLRLAPSGENSLLLPPVGVWAVSQSQSGCLSSQTSYPSSARWAVTPPTTRWAAGPSPRPLPLSSPKASVCGLSTAFALLSPTRGQVPTWSSAVRHSECKHSAFDLHALGTPP